MRSEKFVKDFDATRRQNINGKVVVDVVFTNGIQTRFESLTAVAGRKAKFALSKALRWGRGCPSLGVKSIKRVNPEGRRSLETATEKESADCISAPKSERQAHLDLSEPCIPFPEGTKIRAIYAYSGDLLGRFLGTKRLARPACVCHACHNADCRNPRHIYWGSYSDNVQDAIANGTAYVPVYNRKSGDEKNPAAAYANRCAGQKRRQERIRALKASGR